MFLIIIIAGAIAAMWRISTTQTATSSLAPWVARDEGEEINFYSLSSTAQYSSPGNPDYAYRKLEAVVEVPDSGTGG